MKKIHLLPEHIIAKIAAGEVIERPGFAVKELVENAIDAHADSIAIFIEDAGLKRIAVMDNGEGMNQEDLAESVKSHTTSKIFLEDSLAGITTLGFRGEALSSIAAISNLTIKSRIIGETGGNSITIKNGVLENREPVGMPYGTSVIIDNLFSTIPARKKFLKSKKTEFRLIADIVTEYAISFPGIRFQLWHNEKCLINEPQTHNSLTRIAAMLGKTISDNLLPLTYQDSYLSLSGFIAKPQGSIFTNKQFVFVNNRAVSEKLVSIALKEAYGNVIDMHAPPPAVIFINLPFELVDVNMHPRKEYVGFTDPTLIYHGVKTAAVSALASHNKTAAAKLWKSKVLMSSFAAKTLRKSELSLTNQKSQSVMQIHTLYLLLATEDGFLIVDQHAAHERILYEHFRKIFLRKMTTGERYILPKPVRITIPLSDITTLDEFYPLLERLGFSLQIEKSMTVVIIAVPELFKDREYESLIRDFCQNLQLSSEKINIDRVSGIMLSYLACRGAVKAGNPLSSEQAIELIEQLGKTPHNMSCVHGRPTYREITLKELARLFKRTSR